MRRLPVGRRSPGAAARQVSRQYLPSVLVAQGVAHVQPSLEGLVAGFEYHLVEVAVVLYELHVVDERLVVGHEDVGSLAQGMLAVDDASHLQVEQLTTVSVGDAYMAPYRLRSGSSTSSQSVMRRTMTMMLGGTLSMPRFWAVPDLMNSSRAK